MKLKQNEVLRCLVLTILTFAVLELLSLNRYCRNSIWATIHSTSSFHDPSVNTATERTVTTRNTPTERTKHGGAAAAKKKKKKKTKKKLSLYLLTTARQISLLTKSIFHVLPLQECFDVHWIIVHSRSATTATPITKAPMFRNVFPWITELFPTFNDDTTSTTTNSIDGPNERHIAIQHLLQSSRSSSSSTTHDDHGFVYFLEEDNVLTLDLCHVQDDDLSTNTEQLYYADLYHCDTPRFPTNVIHDQWRCTTTTTEMDCATKSQEVDTMGTCLIPVSMMRRLWQVHLDSTEDGDGDGGGDGRTASFDDIPALVRQANMRNTKPSFVMTALPSSFHFRYHELNDVDGCDAWRTPFTSTQLHESLRLYRQLIDEMTHVHDTLLPTKHKMDRTEITFHDYVHILHVLRYYVTAPTATYVEIGVWKGGTSILMSRHPFDTNVYGVDRFYYRHQRDEADHYRQRLQGKGNIHWIKSDSRLAIPELKKQLDGKQIDILFIDGDHRLWGVKKDFELYAPLVADGGFIVFDDFLDTQESSGVRGAIMELIRDGVIHLEQYDIIGTVHNIMGAGPVFTDDKYFYDWQNITSNEFIIRKRAVPIA